MVVGKNVALIADGNAAAGAQLDFLIALFRLGIAPPGQAITKKVKGVGIVVVVIVAGGNFSVLVYPYYARAYGLNGLGKGAGNGALNFGRYLGGLSLGTRGGNAF